MCYCDSFPIELTRRMLLNTPNVKKLTVSSRSESAESKVTHDDS